MAATRDEMSQVEMMSHCEAQLSSEAGGRRDDSTEYEEDDAIILLSSNGSLPSSSSSLLNVGQAAALLTADILGTGLLALPENVAVLGKFRGIAILVTTLVLNGWAGMLMARTADGVDLDIIANKQQQHDDDEVINPQELLEPPNSSDAPQRKRRRRKGGPQRYNSVVATDDDADDDKSYDEGDEIDDDDDDNEGDDIDSNRQRQEVDDAGDGVFRSNETTNSIAVETSNDVIDLTQQVFGGATSSSSSTTIITTHTATRWVMLTFYVNVFLVLGDYMLVMAHAVSAMWDDEICFPHAGIIAGVLMLGLAVKARQMAHLGRWVTIVSLTSLAIVVIQCLVAVHYSNSASATGEGEEEQLDALLVSQSSPTGVPVLRKLSALASIGFATGSNKLLLNIRHEMKERHKAPKTLGWSMMTFGTVYVAIALLGGANPPGFLFDAIPKATPSRRIAGLFLWIHIAVSYAINSQAMCASIDARLIEQQTTTSSTGTTTDANNSFSEEQESTSSFRKRILRYPRLRWFCLTASLAVSSYLVANAVPFFKDLVALIGALTSVPLAILIPVLQYRKYAQYPLWLPTRGSVASYGLVVFGVLFLVTGLIGAIGSIELDWQNQGKPFSCAPS